MNIYGHPFKFVTMFENDEYYYFLKLEDTVTELIIEFLKIIIGKNSSSSKGYDTKTIFKGVNQPPERNVLTLFSKKKKIAFYFSLRQQLERGSIILYKNIVRSKKKTKQIMVILNTVSNLHQKRLVYQKYSFGMIQMKHTMPYPISSYQ